MTQPRFRVCSCRVAWLGSINMSADEIFGCVRIEHDIGDTPVKRNSLGAITICDADGQTMQGSYSFMDLVEKSRHTNVWSHLLYSEVIARSSVG